MGAKPVKATLNFQKGGPSGREQSAQSITLKTRKKGGKTVAYHTRCAADRGGKLCDELKKVLERVDKLARSMVDQEDAYLKKQRLKAKAQKA